MEVSTNCITDMVMVTCCACGTIFGMAKRLNQERHDDHKNFYCPNGHELLYPQKSKIELLREELRVERVKSMNLEEENRRAQKTAHNGCCPVKGCGQHIRDLDRHMRRKHGKK